MIEPPRALAEIAVVIEAARRGALLSALRRGRAAEALALLDGWDVWQTARAAADEDDDDDEPGSIVRRVLDLGDWVRDECRLHVAAGRFQHALALAERYVALPPLFTAADTKARLARMSDP